VIFVDDAQQHGVDPSFGQPLPGRQQAGHQALVELADGQARTGDFQLHRYVRGGGVMNRVGKRRRGSERVAVVKHGIEELEGGRQGAEARADHHPESGAVDIGLAGILQGLESPQQGQPGEVVDAPQGPLVQISVQGRRVGLVERQLAVPQRNLFDGDPAVGQSFQQGAFATPETTDQSQPVDLHFCHSGTSNPRTTAALLPPNASDSDRA
jgi:hypothetical protein